MKKLHIISCLLLITLICMSCSENSKTPADEKFIQYTVTMNFVSGGNKVITFGTPDIGGTKFYYISKNSEQSLPLCFDPVCSHSDKSCPAAYLSGNTSFNMACSEDTFYYAVNPENSAVTEILSVDINDASRKVLCNLNNRIYGLKLYNGYLYYIENNSDTSNQIYKLKESGGKPELILDGKSNDVMYDLFCVYEDNFYYLKSEHDGLYKYNLDSHLKFITTSRYTKQNLGK